MTITQKRRIAMKALDKAIKRLKRIVRYLQAERRNELYWFVTWQCETDDEIMEDTEYISADSEEEAIAKFAMLDDIPDSAEITRIEKLEVE